MDKNARSRMMECMATLLRERAGRHDLLMSAEDDLANAEAALIEAQADFGRAEKAVKDAEAACIDKEEEIDAVLRKYQTA